MLRGKSKKQAQEELSHEEVAAMKKKAAARVASLTMKATAPQVSSLDAFNTRSGERIIGPLPAFVHLNDDEQLSCVVADYSTEGVKLRMDVSGYLPRVVVVECDALGGLLIGEVRWQDGAEAGVMLDRKMTRRIRLAMNPDAA